MPFDFKKEYKEFYMPKNKPEIVTVPPANYIAVRGTGDPNEPDGAYQQAISVLYAIAYTLKMSYKTDHRIEGFFEYVVPPLEGFWWQENTDSIDYADKSAFHWVSVIRLPDFITPDDFAWAVQTAEKKKKLDCSKAEFLTNSDTCENQDNQNTCIRTNIFRKRQNSQSLRPECQRDKSGNHAWRNEKFLYQRHFCT